MNTELNNDSQNSENRLLMYAIAGVIAIFIAFLASIVVANRFFASEQVGQFGDSFGVMNAMFSALAFAVVVVSIRMQMQEFKISLRELTQSTKAHTESAQLQRDISDLQRFSTLFSAIELLPKLDERISNTQISTFEVACGLNSLREQRLAVLKFVKQEAGLRDQDFSTKVEMDSIVKCNRIIEMTSATAANLAMHIAKSHPSLSSMDLSNSVFIELRKKAQAKHAAYVEANRNWLATFPNLQESMLVKEVADIITMLEPEQHSELPTTAQLNERKESLLTLSSKVLFDIMTGKSL